MADRKMSADRCRDRSTVAGVPRRRRGSDECMLVHGLCATTIALTALRAISTTVAAAVNACLYGLYDACPMVKLTTTLTGTARGLLSLLGGWTSSASQYAAQFGRGRPRQSHWPETDRSDDGQQRVPHRSSSNEATDADQRARGRTRFDRRSNKSTARTDRVAADGGDAWTPLLQTVGRGVRSLLRRGRGHANRPSRPGRTASTTSE